MTARCSPQAPTVRAAGHRRRLFEETLDYNLTKLNGGGPAGSVQINPANLPMRPMVGICKAVFPHHFMKVNTILEVIQAARHAHRLVGQAPRLRDHQWSLG